MKILIIYGTNSGGTQQVGTIISEELQKKKHSFVLMNARDADFETMTNHDLVIFGSCTWELVTPKKRFEGTLQADFLDFRDKLKGKELVGQKFAVFGLGDSSYTNFCIAANHLEGMVRQLKGVLVAEPLKIDKFFFKLEENRKKIRTWAKKLV